MIRELATLFLKLGFTAFGGPAAHIALMHAEVVRRRKWLDEGHFLDLLGATQLIPGPNSTEMAIHIGFVRAGWAGLAVAGASFILPAMFIVMALAWAYTRFGSMPEVSWILYGVKPVVIAIVVQALWDLGRRAVKGPLTAAVGLAVVVLYALGVHEIVLLFLGGLAVLIIQNLRRLRGILTPALLAPLAWSVQDFRQTSQFSLAGLSLAVLSAQPFNLPALFFTFLKIGAVLYGSGYVLLAFLHSDLVVRLGWLTDQQLIDAIAVGQVTPGPVFTTATFVGFILGGVPGALVATLGIFLPAFVFVAISNPLIPRLRNSAWAGALLDGVNVASLGLMAAVTWNLGRASLINPLTVLMALLALIALTRFKLNTTWLIAGGAVIGFLSRAGS